MRYLKTIGNNHYFQRMYPSRLEAAAKRMGLPKVMVKPLDLTVDHPEWQVAKAIAEWNDVFEDVCSIVQNSNTQDIETEQRRRLVLSFLKARDLTPGMFAEAGVNEKAAMALEYALEDVFEDDMNQHHPEFKQRGMVAQFDSEFISTAIDLLTTSITVDKRLTFEDAIDAYLKNRQKKAKVEHAKKDERYCKRFLVTVGNHLLTTENAGRYLKDYRNKLLAEYRGSTAARMLAPPRAALAWAADNQCTDVFVPVIRVEGSTQHEDRYTLTESEMVELVRLITDPQQQIKDYIRLFYLVSIHCGGHMVELRNTLTSDLKKTKAGWQLYVRGSKTTSRPRTIPLLASAVPYVRQWMPLQEDVSLLEEAGKITDSAVDAALKRVVKRIHPKAVPYSVRHGCRNLAIGKGIGQDVQQLLLGWSDGTAGKSQRRYAAAGEANKDQMAAKREAIEKMLGSVDRVLKARKGR